MIHILLVDDHPSVGEGTKVMIEKEEDMKVTIVDAAGKALPLVEEQEFDVMLFDLRMRGMNGIELVKEVRALGKEAPILIYTGYDIGPYFNTLIEAGASGFINKTEPRDQLILSIRSVLKGKVILPIGLFKQLRRMEVQVEQQVVKEEQEEQPEEEIQEDVSINSKEQKILIEVARGKSNREIASIYYKSQRTIEYNLTEIFKKLQVKSRAEAVLKSKQLGIISDEDLIE
ncbi:MULTISPECIES: response regulator transcription factor [Pontibacillus]|uniref:Response regulator transcription factor n=1 Tax=Pontibacillus chungwhensis TaxID=265426 RepID=A0ABY8V0C4_9BACI|nr:MULTISPECIES: response regulator transcription factor [Pontibacillus]MCD5324311.1 response regulator transcription factor [Pontibacillus sp. HN14]WIF99392.1 response regulator transcription factor [Pontibacillus chungwhensis]